VEGGGKGNYPEVKGRGAWKEMRGFAPKPIMSTGLRKRSRRVYRRGRTKFQKEPQVNKKRKKGKGEKKGGRKRKKVKIKGDST